MTIEKMLTSESQGYVDLSEAVAFEDDSDAAITIVETKNSVRFKMSKSLLEDLGNPERVKVLFVADKIAFIASDAANAVAIKQDGMIYNSKLARKIMSVSGAKFTGKSTKIGTYNMQTNPNGTVAAIVSF